MRIIILFNPAAGRGKARRKLAQVIEWLRRGGVEPEVRESESAEHLRRLACQACAEHPDVAVSAGGDGTHHYVLNALVGSEVPIGMLAFGTGNDLARGIGIPRGASQAAAALLQRKMKQIDLGRVGSNVYGGMAGVGFDAVVARYVNERAPKIRGRLAYVWGILSCLRAFRPQPVEVRSEECNFSDEAIAVLVGNHPFYGGGLCLAPRARSDDGLLDVCVVPSLSKAELLHWVPRAYRGEHLRHPRIVYFQARKVTLKSPSRMELFGDGEFIQELPATIEAVPQAVRVIVPL